MTKNKDLVSYCVSLRLLAKSPNSELLSLVMEGHNDVTQNLCDATTYDVTYQRDNYENLALLGTETATNVWFICMRIGLCSTHVEHGRCGELGMFTRWLCTHSSRAPTISPHSFTATPRITAQLISAFIHSYTPYHCTADLRIHSQLHPVSLHSCSPHSFTATPRITAQLCWVGHYREITKVLRESVNFSNLPADMKNNQSILVEFSSRHKN